jgi:alpha-glucosidase
MITNTTLEYKGNLFPQSIISFEKNVDTYTFRAKNNVLLRLTILRDSVVRFRYATENAFEKDFSYALADNYPKGYNDLNFAEDEDYYILTTAKIKIYVAKENMRIGIYTLEGTPILEDELGFHYEENHEYGGNIVKMSKHSAKGESFYGLGDKPSHMNLKGMRFTNWNTDEYAFSKDKDPIYKTIPFYIGLNQNTAYGIFFDNTFRTHFDFASERHGITSFWADGGEMNYYFFYGPSSKEVIKNYTQLTGVPEMPPMWALGYHQSKWSYYPESNFRALAQKFRDLKIPCDAVYLDIDYMEGFRCFTWSKEYFPNPKQMVDDLKADGFKVVVIIDPGIKIDKDYSVYNEAMEKGYFCKRSDGPLMKGKVWPGDCYFPDYTNPEVRTWWAGLYKELIEDIGVRGVWNDMNEPAVMEIPGKTFPLDVRHNYDGNTCSHRKAHNVYGMQMARATYEGVKQFAYPKRPFIITRAAYSGTQRYTSSWTGDNVASWEHLWIANIQVQRMNISGAGFTGTDIGGFAEQPTAELFTRWVQLGVFHPFCRVHSSGHHGEQEPWSFGKDVTDIVRSFIEIRYTLLPYLYTMFWEYIQHGTPMIKPLFYYDQEDMQTHFRTDEFMFGNHILVCPILEPNTHGRRMYIPRGTWINWWTGERVVGGEEVWVDSTMETIPIFVREGACIPKYPVQQYVGEKKIEELQIDVYFSEEKTKSRIYADGGDGYDYKKGRFSLRTLEVVGRPDSLVINQHKEGDYDAEYQKFKLVIHNLPFEVKSIYVDDKRADYVVTKVGNTYELVVDKNFSQFHITG